ncbi:geranylgeranylglycerol-phosphate geranylgeranyltransferase [Dawidia soli]|uniref:Geranylgeranylglycerol-phosphate geranylgeranyltransferase n=1 Tax=Dawidia soli TaxID=2782352 RepID=A0AAP2D858_9BACT|nr:geranylgeranylglycerol-phosphate geranylgeranyltransferase [Dawidia soli]MBT1687211.1 geranylgeranylglycerol-phosphate geranylgeranyltransferase [Dawidia soli]
MATGRTFRTFLESLLKLTRFGNLVIIGLAQYCTAGFLIATTTLNDGSLFILATSTVLIAAAGYIINDYYDVKIDYINKPGRVVIGKSITRRYAILFHVVLSSAGVLLGLMLSWKIAAVNVLTVFLLWFYSNNLKRLPFIGNFVVALLTGLAILIVDLYYHTGSVLIIIYASFAFFMTLVREIIKDMEDLKGDVTFGCKTLPIMLGLRRTKFIIYLILFLFSATVVILNYFYQVMPLQYYAIFLFVPLLWLLYRLVRADTIRDFARLSAFCKVIMLMGILSMSLHGG